MRLEPRGQVLVVVALVAVIILAAAGIAVDFGRQNAEQRHVQSAADAAALAACQALIDGASDNAAEDQARSVALANLQGSPAAATATIAADDARAYVDGHAGDPAYLVSGIMISSTTVRVAISSEMDTALARVMGVMTLDTGGRARCALQGGPAVPIVARRYDSAPGPGGGFVDFAATEATSTNGQVDPISVLGYNGRTPASEAQPGPEFDLYGPGAKAANDASFRGFIALDVRNFEATTSRVYYNGVPPGTNVDTIKNQEGAYLLSGYPGPMFPAVTQPADPNDQVATFNGNDTAMVMGNFSQVHAVGDRIMLAVYNGTVMQIPDFAISPPAAFTVLSTTGSPVAGPNFSVSRNDAFNSTVTLHLRGDANAAAAGYPAYDIVPDPPVSPPGSGDMNQPTWSTDVFIPAKNGTTVSTSGILTNAIPAGIYTVWLEGDSGNPYFQTRRYAVPVKVGGAVRDFSFVNSSTSGSTPSLGGTISLPIYVSTTSASTTKWGAGSSVALTVDGNSFTDCSLLPTAIGAGQLTLSAGSVTPSSSGSGALSTLGISTVGLAPGCYRFDVRGTGTNGSGQPVTHLLTITFTVATVASSGSYVDIIGFEVFEVTNVSANSISGQAVSAIAADPNDPTLRRAESARLAPWS